MERFADELDLVQLRIDQAIESAIAEILRPTREAGAGRQECVDCGEPIPKERQQRIPNAQRCTQCQNHQERRRSLYAA